MKKPMSKDKIPQSDSIQELAQFWDTHDLTEYEDQLEEVAEPVFEPQTAVTIHLPSREAEAVEKLAKLKDIDSANLIRQWVLERVQKPAY
jgi:hypothetical protein